VPPYVEIRADGVLREEGPVNAEQKFTFPLTGRHVLTVWVINPETRNHAVRRARVARVQIL